MINTVKGRGSGRPVRLVVGVADVVPKLLASRILESALKLPQAVQIVCWENKLDRLLAELAIHELDLVLADSPVPPTVKVQAHSHLLGESEVTLFASARLSVKHRRMFPQSLEGAPFLLPTNNSTLRRSLDSWFLSKSIQPKIVGEFEDSATLKAFGQAGHGIFPGSAVIKQEICQQYKVQVVGQADSVRQRFYGITVERRLSHPAVVAIFEQVRKKLLR